MKRWATTTKTACTAALIAAAIGPAQAQLAPPPKLLPQALPRAAPAPVPAPTSTSKAAPAPAGWCEEDCLLGPAKPLRFELLAGERASGAFAVTAPGPIRIELQASGVPLVLSLRRPDGRSVERQGSGSIVIDDAASAADIARGVLWGVGVRAAQEAPPGAQGAVAARAPLRSLASGTLGVQHPPADKAAVSAALKQAGALAQQQAASRPPPAPAPVDSAALARQAQAEHDKSVAARHAAMLGQLRAALPAPAHAQLSQRIALRQQGQTLQQATAAVPVQLVRAEAMVKPVTLAAPAATPLPMTKAGLQKAAPATGSTQAAATGGATAVGSSGGAAVAAPAPAPAPTLVSASTGEGDPGTPVTLSGSEFGNAPGEVRFIVGNGRDIAAPVTYWSAAQIVAEVPYADGLPVYDGHVYVKRADGAKTALRPFRFVPLYDVTEIGLPDSRGDYLLAASDNNRYQNGGVFHRGALFWGFKGNDKFYERSQTRNGWEVTGARVSWVGATPGTGDAYLVETRPGTASPYVNVRWWVNGSYPQPSFDLGYSIRVELKRPKNLLPCAANVPCPVL